MKFEKMYFRKPKWLRRIASAFLDIFSAVILSLLLSFLATIYPAIKASKTNPVDVLRYE